MKTDGNVVYPSAWRQPVLPDMTFVSEVLFADEYATLLRITYRISGQVFVQHIASGVGLDD